MATDTTRGTVHIFDDFVGDAFNGDVWNISADAGGTSEVAAVAGGVHRLATDTTDNDMSEVGGAGIVWRVQDGFIEMEARVQVETGAVNTVAITVGFNDDDLEDSNTLPVELATATWTSNATTFCGFVYDADATNADWHVFWVDDDADTSEALADLRIEASTPVADTYQTLKVRLTDRGAGKGARGEFWLNGKLVKTFNTTIDRDVLLTPHVAMENRAGAAHNVDVDYISVCGARP